MRLDRFAVILCAIVSVCSFPAYAQSEWKQAEDGRYWYELDYGGGNKSYYKDGVYQIDQKWYMFDSSGYMVTGWVTDGGSWYYFDPASGARVTGMNWIDGKLYCFDFSSGGMRTGMIESDDKLYYFGSSGAAETGFFLTSSYDNPKENYYYYADENGVILRNARKDDPDNNRTMFFESDGRIKYRTDLMEKEGVGWLYLTESSSEKSQTYGEYYEQKEAERVEKEAKNKARQLSECLPSAFSAYKKNYIYKDQGKIDSWKENTRNEYLSLGGDEAALNHFFSQVERREYGASLIGSDEPEDIAFYGKGCFKNYLYHLYPEAEQNMTQKEEKARRKKITELMNFSYTHLSAGESERFFKQLQYGTYTPSYKEYYFYSH